MQLLNIPFWNDIMSYSRAHHIQLSERGGYRIGRIVPFHFCKNMFRTKENI